MVRFCALPPPVPAAAEPGPVPSPHGTVRAAMAVLVVPVEWLYNPRQRHSVLDYVSPVQFGKKAAT